MLISLCCISFHHTFNKLSTLEGSLDVEVSVDAPNLMPCHEHCPRTSHHLGLYQIPRRRNEGQRFSLKHLAQHILTIEHRQQGCLHNYMERIQLGVALFALRYVLIKMLRVDATPVIHSPVPSLRLQEGS